MHHNDFIKTLSDLAKIELPNLISHKKMAPLDRIKLLEQYSTDKPDAKNAAVMMLLYPKNNKTHLALIKRNEYPGVHSSQIAFPGGKVEIDDESFKHAAVRETHEEIGVHPEKFMVIRNLSTVYIPPSNYLVHPFLGISNHELNFILQEDEVAGLIETPLQIVLDDSIIVTKNMATSYANNIEIPAFEIDGHLVWGATAMMLSELKDIIKKVL